ncbi:MAG: bifunctional diaminohydroxyphosphoribosylaminopyrimidine deaminase/5-amino-6-(5-phosphoribosylamino)uracil reductase RibD [Armatimonadota bacterium]
MKRALVLARRGNTSPNPMVGAVVVKDGRIVGEGYHRKAGEPHAEVIALRNAGELASGADLYVTLEPCCHFGRTPPCTKAVIEAGIRSVTAAMVDPNPKVAGKGLAELETAGIHTCVGVLEEEARKLNEVFIKFITTGLPFVTLKLAMTLDGKIATSNGDSKWISCEESRRTVHRLRERTDAVLVGIGTVLADNPELTARIGTRRSYPARVVVDSSARTPVNAKLLSQPDGEAIIAVRDGASEANLRKLKQAGARIIEVAGETEEVSLTALMRELGQIKKTGVLIEGGGRIAASALSSGIVDKVLVFIAPKIVGGESARTPVEGSGVAAMADALRLRNMSVKKVGCDLLIEAYPCSQG